MYFYTNVTIYRLFNWQSDIVDFNYTSIKNINCFNFFRILDETELSIPIVI